MSQNDTLEASEALLESAAGVTMIDSITTESSSFVNVDGDVVEEIDEVEEIVVIPEGEEEEADSISSEAHVVKPVKPAPQVRPPPDLRFEESYLRAISAADGKWWKIAYITVRDQVFMPLIQGTIWSFLLLSASSLRARSSGSGRYYGSSFVRWWRSINPPNGKH
ncbi:hypothetical protein CJU89_3826 [Yarrowia sp. B02]|nr:hypothetical protein CJU89_3826 [Yarrowia sp. B02]